MHIDYEVSEQDFIQAHKLALKNAPSWVTRAIPWMGPLAGIAGMLFLGYAWFSQGFKTNLIYGSLFCWWFISIPFMMRRGRKKAYAKTTSFHGPMSMDMDANGVFVKANGVESRIAWTNFANFLEDEKSFVILQNSSIFHPITKRYFSAEQVTELRECLQQNIGQRK